MSRGYFGIAVDRPKTTDNVGTLWRSAHVMGAAYLAVIGGRYKKQPSDVLNSSLHVPLLTFETFDDFYDALPDGCQLIGVEMCHGAESLPAFRHPARACYLLGPEDGSLTDRTLLRCHSRVLIPGAFCLNLAVAGSIVIYDRVAKQEAGRS